jgi:transketolase
MSLVFKTKPDIAKLRKPSMAFGKRRAVVVDVDEALAAHAFPMSDAEKEAWECHDLIYRTLCAVLYNFVPMSGHPGGSISSGRMAAALIYNTIDYDFSDPNCASADIVSYAAGHKAMGLYAMWALRNEIMRLAHPEMLPAENLQLRLEDLLGFRRNPTQETPLFRKFHAKPLDGHPTPATPFIRLSTGASGVGVPASLGLALGAMDTYRGDPPRVHIVEGEGGMTPGRTQEALAAASSARLWNAVMHVDWNQASIDSERVCREGDQPGDYVQWDPVELGHLHDWNVVVVKDGMDMRKVLAAQQIALGLETGQPTMIVYRTVKGWQYGIQGRKSHGAGHAFCCGKFYDDLTPFENRFKACFPRYEGDQKPENVEAGYYNTLLTIRHVLEDRKDVVGLMASGVAAAKARLAARGRKPRAGAPRIEAVYDRKVVDPLAVPPELVLKAGTGTTLRGELGRTLNHLNKLSGGAFIGAAADLLESTSVSILAEGFPAGLYNAVSNPDARLIAAGGICEDGMSALMAGLSAYGRHIGVGSSYGAFIAALSHIASRLHGIGQQMKRSCIDEPYNPWIMINAHAGIKTGEDGPTHADPQPLQLLQENFPRGVLITLTPWDPAEMWPLVVEALGRRPAILAPFVTRPKEKVPDRTKARLPDVTSTVSGVYALRKADMTAKQYNGTLVLQGSGVTTAFVGEVLPRLDEQGMNLNVYYVSSAELFDLLPHGKQEEIYPVERAVEAMGITDHTLPTMYRWVLSPEGRRRTMFPHRGGRYLGSGQAAKVLEEAGQHAEGQLGEIMDYARTFEKRTASGAGGPCLPGRGRP